MCPSLRPHREFKTRSVEAPHKKGNILRGKPSLSQIFDAVISQVYIIRENILHNVIDPSADGIREIYAQRG